MLALAAAAFKLAISPAGRWVVGAVVLLSVLSWFRHEERVDAVNKYRAEQREQEADRVRKATRADEASRRCAADPACRLRPDDAFRGND